MDTSIQSTIGGATTPKGLPSVVASNDQHDTSQEVTIVKLTNPATMSSETVQPELEIQEYVFMSFYSPLYG